MGPKLSWVETQTLSWRPRRHRQVQPVLPPTYSIGETFSYRTPEYDQVPLPSIPRSLTRRAIWLAATFGVLASGILTALAARPDEPASDSVGIIDGAAIAVTGPMRVEVVSGFARTILRSGSDVRVKSGTARLELVEGGTISICGPAHFSVLKYGNSLTVALDRGSIHAYIERDPALTIYTPQIQAQTVAIGDGPQDVFVGFDAAGAICIRAYRGAIRVEQQLTGQNVLIPQSGNIALPNGQLDGLRAGNEQCACDPQISKYTPPPPPLEVAPQATASEVAQAKPLEHPVNASSAPVDGPGTKDEPVYEVVMPPLIYVAKAKKQPEVDPAMMVLVRRVRVRPTLIFQGRVEGEGQAAAFAAPAPSSARANSPTVSQPKPAAPANDSFVERVRHYVRRLWSRGG